MKKIIALLLALVMALAFAACGNSSPSTAADSSAAEAGGKIILGTSADYAPFEFHILDNGEDKIVGSDVALAYQIAADMGKELDIADMNFDNLLTLMAQGNCDFVIAAMEQSEERLQNASCSDPYYTDLPAMIVVKKDKTRQAFDRNKLMNGLMRACEKRPVSIATLESAANEIEAALYNSLEREVPSSVIGEMVMDKLRGIDDVAYVRFASVYRQFKDINTFMDELSKLINSKK